MMSFRVQPSMLVWKTWCRLAVQSRNLSTLRIRPNCGKSVLTNPEWHRSGTQNLPMKRFVHQIVEEGVGTHKPSAFQKKVLVWGKVYPSVEKVPERVTRNQLKRAMDKFRVRVSIMMVAATFVASAVMATIGRRERQAGKSVTSMNLEKRKDL